MSLTVSIDDPAYEKGELLGIAGLGIENGGNITLDEEEEALFEAVNGAKVRDFFKGHPFVKVEGTTEKPKGGES